MKGLPGSRHSSPSCGMEWDRSSGNVRGWKCILEFAVQDWFESVGQGVQGWMAEVACSSQKAPVITAAAELD